MCEIGKLSGELHWQIGNEKARLKFSETDNGIRLETIIVPSRCRGQGIGSKLLEQFISCTDSLGKDIYLSARPIAGRTNPERLERLVRFYKRLGFKEIERGVTTCHMVRHANTM